MAEKTTKTAKKSSTRLVGADGATLRLVTQVTKTGVKTYAIHALATVNGKSGAKVRGASQQHPTLEKAQEAIASLLAAATKAGWTLPTPRVPAAAPDAFDAAHLPSPAKVAPKK